MKTKCFKINWPLLEELMAKAASNFLLSLFPSLFYAILSFTFYKKSFAKVAGCELYRT